MIGNATLHTSFLLQYHDEIESDLSRTTDVPCSPPTYCNRVSTNCFQIRPRRQNTKYVGSYQVVLSNLVVSFIHQISWYLSPKTPWDQIIGCLLFGHPVRRKMFFFNFFWDKWSTYLTSSLATPCKSNSNFVWACDEFLNKIGWKFSFPILFEELLHVAIWLNLPRGWREGCQKRSSFCT